MKNLHKNRQRLKSTVDRTDCKPDTSSRTAKTSPQVMGRHSIEYLSNSYTAYVQAADVSKDTGVKKAKRKL